MIRDLSFRIVELLLERSKLEDAQLIARAGCSASALGRWRGRESLPSEKHEKGLLRALNVTNADFADVVGEAVQELTGISVKITHENKAAYESNHPIMKADRLLRKWVGKISPRLEHSLSRRLNRLQILRANVELECFEAFADVEAIFGDLERAGKGAGQESA